MPSFSPQRLFTMPGAAILHDPVLHAFQPPLLALGVALALGLIGRAAGARWLLANAGAAGALAGWMMLPAGAVLRTVLTPRTMTDFLLLPAAAVLVVGLAAPWLRGRAERWRGRAERWLPIALAVLAGWWLAGSAPARPEFWRVWLAVGLVAWLLARGGGAGAVGRAAGGRGAAGLARRRIGGCGGGPGGVAPGRIAAGLAAGDGGGRGRPGDRPAGARRVERGRPRLPVGARRRLARSMVDDTVWQAARPRRDRAGGAGGCGAYGGGGMAWGAAAVPLMM